MGSDEFLETPSKKRQRMVSFPSHNSSGTPGRQRPSGDLWQRARARSEAGDESEDELADPLHGDLSYSMPHTGFHGSSSDQEADEAQHKSTGKDAAEVIGIEMSYMTPRRRKNAAGTLIEHDARTKSRFTKLISFRVIRQSRRARTTKFRSIRVRDSKYISGSKRSRDQRFLSVLALLQIVRRLRNRTTLKKSGASRPSFRNMSYDWQFAGWGS